MMILCCFCFLFFRAPVEVIDGTQQKFTAGTKNGGGGVKYSLKIIANCNSDQIQFSEFWVENKSIPFNIFTTKSTKEFEKGDTLIIKASSNTHHTNVQKTEKETINPKPIYDGVAALILSNNNKSNVIEIKEFRKLPAIYYP